ncbi:MAG: toll/interleukin-1 receptor domain-containing protein [Verrucomicrobiota bacterium]
MQEPESKYLAFISYSRSDNDQDGRRWADWIKEMIEKFPIPINCLPANTESATSFGRTREVFLDRSRLTAGGELTPKLESHLSQAEYLVVVCSPRSAASEYVDFEIDSFKKSGRTDRIIPIVIDGSDAGLQGGNCWIPESLRDLIQIKKAGEGTEKPRDVSLIYSDFRTREKLPNLTVFEEQGWTDPAFYEKHLRSKNLYSESVMTQYASAYRQAHSVAKFALLGAIFGLEPVQLEGQSLLEENERKQQVIRQNRKNLMRLGLFSLAMACMAAVTYGFYRKAEAERLKSERSLQMIGDAHERTTRLIADLMNDLGAREEPIDKAVALADARRFIGDYFDEVDPSGDDDESLHMRAVVHNSKGHLALKTGDLAAAFENYTKSAGIGEKLLSGNGPKALYLHNISISHDNLGDWYVANARKLAEDGLDPEAEYDKAIHHYREGLAKAKALAALPDATAQWNHDVAIGYLKVSAGLKLAGDHRGALDVLKEGLPIAEKVAASDRSYVKWQAHLGAYYLAMGELHDALVETPETRSCLLKGEAIFSGLAAKKPLGSQYADWQRQIEEILDALQPVDGKEQR